LSRETELRAAIDKADLPPRDFKIYMVLFRRAEWHTAEIDPKFQPRSLTELARWSTMPRSVLAAGLNHLEHHNWIERNRWRTPGRGHTTRYKLTVGTDCDCHQEHGEPMTDAERMRRYRARRKASGSSVTEAGKVSGERVTAADQEVSGFHVTQGAKESGIHVTKCPAVTNDFAGQTHFSAKRIRTRGEVKRDTPNATQAELPVPAPANQNGAAQPVPLAITTRCTECGTAKPSAGRVICQTCGLLREMARERSS
jgi:hypothetical protein